MPAATELLVSRRLGAYLIGRKLGAGGMATVFAARHEGTHVKRLVALKVLSANISKEDEEHRAFVREALVATRLEHPNIVRTYDVGEADGTLFLAMELVHGASLSACTKASDGPAPIPIALRITGDIARALHAAHELEDPEKGHLGVVHQDVSPQNILIAYDGSVKLVDFGVARFGTLEGSRTESLRGKPSYASPEQISGKNIDRRTDVFALGVILWELLTGARLFKRETSAATYLAVLQDPIPDVRDVNAYVNEALAAVVAKALMREREQRYRTAEELRLALVAAREQGGMEEASAEKVAAWVAKLVAPTLIPADLEREIVKADGGQPPNPPSRRHGATDATDVSPLAPPEAPIRDAEIPDLDLPGVSQTRPASQAKRPPASDPQAAPAEPAPALAGPSLPAQAQRRSSPGLRVETPSDDFDMQIERDVAGASMPMATSSRRMPAASPIGGGPRASLVSSTNLELAAEPQGRRRDRDDAAPSVVQGFLAWAVTGATFVAATGALVSVAHRSGGRPLASLAPRAFDGTSASLSALVSMVTLILAVAMGFAGVKAQPRSWALVVGATAMLLTALAMVTVTLASTGEAGTPPDGTMLLPYLVPVAILGVALGIAGRAPTLVERRGAAGRALALPVVLAAAALAFVAYETSFLVVR